MKLLVNCCMWIVQHIIIVLYYIKLLPECAWKCIAEWGSFIVSKYVIYLQDMPLYKEEIELICRTHDSRFKHIIRDRFPEEARLELWKIPTCFYEVFTTDKFLNAVAKAFTVAHSYIHRDDRIEHMLANKSLDDMCVESIFYCDQIKNAVKDPYAMMILCQFYGFHYIGPWSAKGSNEMNGLIARITDGYTSAAEKKIWYSDLKDYVSEKGTWGSI